MEEKEYFFSGYCRTADGSRTVSVELYDGKWEADCSYENCPYAPNCTIAQQIKEQENLC